MKRFTVILAGLSLLGTGGVLWQGRVLSDLRLSKPAVGFQSSSTAVDSNPFAALESEAAALKSETKDLPRLRNEVGQLRAKQNELANARTENERLVDAKRTGAPLPREVPPGFISREQLRNVGYETPENTVQTFLWAMREGNYETVMQSFALENRERAYFENLSPENRAKEASNFKDRVSERMMQYFNDFGVARREDISED
ncbi:MAG TPA: hypothetical protein VNT99_20050, partial [Methylomirabilota bacterium]|nr:hypothetical protein [Methylomirabilota bacterium]